MRDKLVQINYKHLRKGIPYQFLLYKWKTGIRYKEDYVLFDACFEFFHADRVFKLCLPISPVLKALNPLPLRFKQAEMVRVTLKKNGYNDLEISQIEVVDG